jgi:Fe-S cluster assembly protein SufD
MHKFVQVHTGQNNLEFRVLAGKTLNLVLVGTVNFDARLTVRLTGIDSNATITGILIGKGDIRQTLHTMQIHEAAGTTSDLLVKTVLSDRAKCLYDGGIRVEKKARKTNAYQRNENLLLSGRAYAESKPSLEILANDVRCTHGSTTGPVDEQELWYLTTRGIPKAAGEKLITEGFIRSALMRIGDKGIINKLWQTLFLP